MPELTWRGKGLAPSAPASLVRDCIIYPHGIGYPGDEIENRLLLGDNLSVMTALLPENGLDAAASVNWLLESLNSIAPDARKAIRSVNF